MWKNYGRDVNNLNCKESVNFEESGGKPYEMFKDTIDVVDSEGISSEKCRMWPKKA